MGKLVYDEKNGNLYVSNNGIEYDVVMGVDLKGKLYNDMVFVALSFNEELFEECDMNENKRFVNCFMGASCGEKYIEGVTEGFVNHYEEKHPEIVNWFKNWFKKNKRIIKPMPAELHDMLKKFVDVCECGGIRSYYDKEIGFDEFEYSDSTLVHNFMCCCEEVACALLDEDIDRAEELIKIFAKDKIWNSRYFDVDEIADNKLEVLKNWRTLNGNL